MVDQGDILKVEGIKSQILVISKSLYNESGKVVACPLLNSQTDSSFLVEIQLADEKYFVESDSVKKIDIAKRGYRVVGRAPLAKLMIVLDMVQAIIEIV